MRRLGSVLLPAALVLSIALQVSAQRSGHGGGFSSAPSGGGFHGGFHAPSFSGSQFSGSHFSSGSYFGSRGTFATAPRSFVRQPIAGNLRSQALNLNLNRLSAGNSGNRRPYRHHPGSGGGNQPYGYGYGNYLVPNLVGYPFGFDNGFDDGFDDQQDDASAAQQEAYPPNQPEQPGADYGPPPQAEFAENAQPGIEYRPLYPGANPQPPVPAQPATTIVFNDGRPNAQVHNYVLTRTALYDLDGGTQREIPLSEINVPATAKTNRSAGVDFTPPAG